MMFSRLACSVAATLLIANTCLSEETEEAAGEWMKFIRGKWSYEFVENGDTGDFVVEETVLENVLSARGINKDGRTYFVGLFVWDKNDKTIKLFGGFENADGAGSTSLNLNKFEAGKVSGKRGEDDAGVGYEKVDENTWHVVDGSGKITIKLKRNPSPN